MGFRDSMKMIFIYMDYCQKNSLFSIQSNLAFFRSQFEIFRLFKKNNKKIQDETIDENKKQFQNF